MSAPRARGSCRTLVCGYVSSSLCAFLRCLKRAAQHSTACHNTSGQVRVAGQNHWIPWWFNAQYGGGEDGYGVTGWLNREDLEAMPPDLQPLFSHLCVEVS